MTIIQQNGAWSTYRERRQVAWGEIAMACGVALAAALAWVLL